GDREGARAGGPGERLTGGVCHSDQRRGYRRQIEEVIHVWNARSTDTSDRALGREHGLERAGARGFEELQVVGDIRALRTGQAVGLDEFRDAGDISPPVGEIPAGERAEAMRPRVLGVGPSALS